MPDQAAGLRSLFARRRPSLLIAAGSDPRKAGVAAHFAREAAAANRATVIVDGSAGQVARACSAACRYELAQVLTGDRALADVLRPLSPYLMLLPAARALNRFAALDGQETARLNQAFSSGIGEGFAAAGTADAQVDLIVVNADDGQAATALDAFGRDARVVVVASNCPSSMRAAYAEMRTLAQAHGVENFEVVVPVADDPSEAGVTFANLANTARRFLDIELVDGGTVPVPMPAPPADLRGTLVSRNGTRRSPSFVPSSAHAPAFHPASVHQEVSHAAVH